MKPTRKNTANHPTPSEIPGRNDGVLREGDADQPDGDDEGGLSDREQGVAGDLADQQLPHRDLGRDDLDDPVRLLLHDAARQRVAEAERGEVEEEGQQEPHPLREVLLLGVALEQARCRPSCPAGAPRTEVPARSALAVSAASRDDGLGGLAEVVRAPPRWPTSVQPSSAGRSSTSASPSSSAATPSSSEATSCTSISMPSSTSGTPWPAARRWPHPRRWRRRCRSRCAPPTRPSSRGSRSTTTQRDQRADEEGLVGEPRDAPRGARPAARRARSAGCRSRSVWVGGCSVGAHAVTSR